MKYKFGGQKIVEPGIRFYGCQQWQKMPSVVAEVILKLQQMEKSIEI
jgi:hypothetical protein